MPVIGGFISSLIIPTIYKSWGKYKPIVAILEFCTILTFFGFLWGCYL
jgi:FLVCR family feline leukemia virus subgroup C receptor-related protein